MTDDTTNSCPLCNAREEAMARLAEMGFYLHIHPVGNWRVWNGILGLYPERKEWAGPTYEAAINAAWEAWQKEREG